MGKIEKSHLNKLNEEQIEKWLLQRNAKKKTREICISLRKMKINLVRIRVTSIPSSRN